MRRWISLGAIALAACGLGDVRLVNAGSDGATMKVSPSCVSVAPLQPDQESTFTLEVVGNDTLVGLRWLPGIGSNLDLLTRDIGERFIGSDGDRFEIRYTVRDEVVAEGDTDPPEDDGILRLFFRSAESVDVWVEIDDPPRPGDTDPACPGTLPRPGDGIFP